MQLALGYNILILCNSHNTHNTVQDEGSNQDPIWKSASVSGANISEVDGPRRANEPAKCHFRKTR